LAGGSGILVTGSTAGLRAVGTADNAIIFEGIGGSAWTGAAHTEGRDRRRAEQRAIGCNLVLEGTNTGTGAGRRARGRASPS
jgi:hypothetical protein